ncbi:MAG: energy-coupling factor ABC transporter ATP-binding protein [Treponema sp.]|nr:energy-coupling factor ABC transporter ATP-binding protein [Treponema sp.]
MIELKNVSYSYDTENRNCEFSQENSVRSQSDRRAAGGQGETVWNGSLHDINLTVSDEEFVLLTGGSGCGKTTLLRLINGLIPNFFEGKLEGSVTVDGFDVSHAELYDTAKTVSTVFQNPRSQFFNVDTTSELAFACENQGMEEGEILKRIENTVNTLHLEPLMNRSLFELSGGQKQKIACASVAVTGNKVILLDEPSANLDLQTIDELSGLLRKWKAEGKTIIVAEHRISYLWDLADRTIILNNGRIQKELSRTQMNKLTEEALHKMGLRTNVFSSAELQNKTEKSKSDSDCDAEDYITIKNFFYKYKNGLVALNIPYMKIPSGQITAITGENGKGKTTFLNTLCGLGHRAKGVMEYKGKTYKRSARQKSVFLVMQDVNHQLFTESVLDEVLISQKEENSDQACKILESLDLGAFKDRHPQSLSGGQKQRVAVASAIASGRDIMLFDEPTSGLDYTHMLQIGKILRELKTMGKTVIVVTHDRELIKECCDTEIRLGDFNKV